MTRESLMATVMICDNGYPQELQQDANGDLREIYTLKAAMLNGGEFQMLKFGADPHLALNVCIVAEFSAADNVVVEKWRLLNGREWRSGMSNEVVAVEPWHDLTPEQFRECKRKLIALIQQQLNLQNDTEAEVVFLWLVSTISARTTDGLCVVGHVSLTLANVSSANHQHVMSAMNRLLQLVSPYHTVLPLNLATLNSDVLVSKYDPADDVFADSQ